MRLSYKNPSMWRRDNKIIEDGKYGGTSTYGDHNSWYPELWSWLVLNFELKSVLDVGCGLGFSQKFFHDMGLITFGLEGSTKVLRGHQLLKEEVDGGGRFFLKHDLEQPWESPLRFDMVWCCEVAEHIAPESADSFVSTLTNNCGKVLALTAAPPGAGGYHHVNCQPASYWIQKIEGRGLTYDPDFTKEAKSMCEANCGRTMDNYFQRSGMVFVR